MYSLKIKKYNETNKFLSTKFLYFLRNVGYRDFQKLARPLARPLVN